MVDKKLQSMSAFFNFRLAKMLCKLFFSSGFFLLSAQLFFSFLTAQAKLELGVDVFFQQKKFESWKNKRLGLIVNQTSLNKDLKSTILLFQEQKELCLVALFSPEHGLRGLHYAGEKVEAQEALHNLPVYSLHGQNRRPSEEMLKKIDVLIYDIQEIGIRPYTYATTLFYAIEEAAKKNIEVIVLDRPNPINGILVEGPLLDEELRSFVGYINVPYVHGMTIGELALFFNQEYKIGAKLTVIPMKGWKREMSYQETGLSWIPTSPNIPESDTPLYCASTGILGELSLVNIGIGYTMPFKIIGAPWINAKNLAQKLNAQKLPGVKFLPFYFRPFFGPYKGENCQGVQIVITDAQSYHPLASQYLLIGLLKTLYPERFAEKLAALKPDRQKFFNQINGSPRILETLKNEKYAAWKLFEIKEKDLQGFLAKRAQYLLY